MHRAISALAAGLIVVGLAGPIKAGSFEDGFSAYFEGDYAAALREWVPLAKTGNASAQPLIGFMYSMGQGVAQNEVEAARWLRMAAEQGYALAQSNLGARYAIGKGVTQDYAEAVKWLRLAADQGFADAQHLLGYMYASGEGLQESFVKAHMWFSLAAAQGHENAKQHREHAVGMMTDSQILDAERLAREWLEAHQ